MEGRGRNIDILGEGKVREKKLVRKVQRGKQRELVSVNVKRRR